MCDYAVVMLFVCQLEITFSSKKEIWKMVVLVKERFYLALIMGTMERVNPGQGWWPQNSSKGSGLSSF